MTLDEVLADCCARIFTRAEMDDFCSRAVSEGRAQDMLLGLLKAATDAARQNLTNAPTLTHAHVAQQHGRSEAIQRKVQDRTAVSQRARTSGVSFIFSDHAIARYAERHLEGTAPDEAIRLLNAEAVTATPIRARTASGEQQWLGVSGVIFVMRRDHAGAWPICVTVLPREEDKPHGRQKVEGKPPNRCRRYW